MSQNKQEIESQLRGWPGYRTRDNRSGLDPLDTQAEAAHMEGVFIRNLFTLNLRTNNLFYLCLMAAFGVIPFIVLVVIIFGVAFSTAPSAWGELLLPGAFLIPTGALTVNFVLSILEIAGLVPSAKGIKSIQQNIKQRDGRKKKLPKHRKDYK